MPERRHQPVRDSRTRSSLIVLSCLALLLTFAISAPAQGGAQPGAYIVARGGMVTADMEETKSGFAAGGGFEYRPSPRIGLGLLYDYVSFDVPASALSESSLTLHAFSGNFAFYFTPESKINPYVNAGVIFFGASLDDKTSGDLSSIGFDTNTDASANTGFALGGGVQIASGEKGAFDVSARFILSDLDATFSITDVVTGIGATSDESYDMNLYLIEFGYTFSF